MTVLAKLQAPGNETRFKIVGLVREGEMTAGGIARHFKLTRPDVSHHIGILRDAGLLDERRVGASVSTRSMARISPSSSSMRKHFGTRDCGG